MVTALESAQFDLASIVGAPRVVCDSATCDNLAVDGVAPKSVIYPQTPEQVAAVLKCAADHDLAVIPSRSGTQLGMGHVPRRYDLALSLKDLNNVWHYEPADLTLSAEPGIKFVELQALLARQGLWLPLDPPGGARASVGGILAANATGGFRLLYGTPRDMVLGVKVATTEGKLIRAGGRVVKNVAGYDLTKLILGSYGTLGVIVEANFKLFPLPAERATFAFRVPSSEVAGELRRRITDSPLTPMRMVLMNAEAEAMASAPGATAANGPGLQMWVEAGGTRRVLDRYACALEALGKAANLTLQNLEPEAAARAWGRLADIGSSLAADYPGCVSVRVSLPLASTEVFVMRAEQEASQNNLRMALLAQTAAGYVNLHIAEAPNVATLVSSLENLRQSAQTLRGTLVIERCLPGIKARVDVWGPSGNDFELQRRIKETWDPKSILAPGRFVGGL